MRYLELNNEDIVINIIVWNGVEEYTPASPSVKVLPCSENIEATYGWKLVDNTWVAPVIVEEDIQ